VAGYFIDTSALVKLYHPEIGSDRMDGLAQTAGAAMIVSQLSLLEIESVLATKIRTKVISQNDLERFRGLFYADLSGIRFAVAVLTRRHFHVAEGLLRSHAVERGLRTLDALQLSVALDLMRRGAASDLVTSDKNLAAAGVAEGLRVVDPTQD
jgi:predicted nucleic acid-binding protein